MRVSKRTKESRHTAHGVDGGILRVRYNKGKLRTRVPALRRPLWIGVVEVYGDGIVWWSVGITEREK